MQIAGNRQYSYAVSFPSMFYCFFCIDCDDAEAKTPLSDDIIMYLVYACITIYVNWRNSTLSLPLDRRYSTITSITSFYYRQLDFFKI